MGDTRYANALRQMGAFVGMPITEVTQKTMREAADRLEELEGIVGECVQRGQAVAMERDRLQAELHRCRTTETASAHALDVVRQHHGLPLIPGEHPSDTAKRLTAECGKGGTE